MTSKKQTRQRNKQGTVAVSPRGKMLRIRWRYQGQDYNWSPRLLNTPANRAIAQTIASRIQGDIANEKADGVKRFDETLAKYQLQSAPQGGQNNRTTASMFEAFSKHRHDDEDTSGQAIASRYNAFLSNLKRFGRNIITESDAKDFVSLLRSRQCPTVANQNLSLAKSFADWSISQGWMEVNPFANISRLKNARRKNPKRRPFDAQQIRAFLDAIRADRYYKHYHDFCMTLFYLGVRPSEAIGLRWKDIDWQRHVVTLSESLSRGEDGRTSGRARQRKSTKNDQRRIIDIHPNLYAMLKARKPEKADAEALIFISPHGNPIDDHSFSQRAWKKICQRIDIERVPYASRHSLGSHLLENGATIPQVAATLGNTPETTARYYSHMIDRPEMPGF